MAALAELGKEIENLLRLRTRVIGFKRLSKEKDLESIPNVERIGHYSYFCQLPTYCRTKGVSIGGTTKEIMPSCSTIVGLRELPPEGRDGTDYMRTWVTTKADAKKRIDAIPRIQPVIRDGN